MMVLVLAMALSYSTGGYIEGGVLSAVIFLNVAIGFFQELKAEKKMDSLRTLSSPSASVLRNHKIDIIPRRVSPKFVANQNYYLEQLGTNGIEEDEIDVSDRVHMAYSTTTVTRGRGRGIATFTGMQTEVGKIAASTARKNRKPGQSMNLKKYGKAQPVKGTLTQGAMIVKVWLPKFGILTVNKSTDPNNPTQGEVVVDSEAISQLSDLDYSDEKSDFDHQRSTAGLKEPSEQPAIINDDLEAFLRPTALCNLATVKEEQAEGEDSKKWRTIGEPTEIALEIAEFPFDSSIKRMSVVYKNPGSRKSMVYTKGAVERVLDLCSSISVGARNEPMTDLAKQDCLTCMEHFARHGQRILGFASKTWDGAFPEQHGRNVDSLRPEVEDNLTLVGLVGIYDPPPDETKAAVRECSEAGIRVHMPTEDHPATAEAIAKEIGIVLRNMGILPKDVAVSLIFKATDFDKPTDAEINALPEFPLVVARCAPDTKTRMIEALRRRGLFIAMTGDGVNDVSSPSFADVGIAIGLAGSDVAKEAAKIVLTDDKFTSIVSAIREGRRVFDNIQKFILHLLKSNIGEVILLIAGLGFQDSSGQSVFPLSPLQIL
ncbi:hypothetical protein JHW43_003318 [Diplocarpon mali]|nr:hypothetical protein JHW43_003318 [Diplocarpon mali]